MPRKIAYLFSIVFHPLLITTYMLVLLLIMNPYLFGVGSISARLSLILVLLFSTFFMPVLMIMMLKKLELIEQIELTNRQDRTIPYILTGFFYIVMTVFFMYHPDVPNAFTSFMLGATIALFIAFFINLFSKISIHAVGMGGLLGMAIITIWQFSYGVLMIYLGTLGTLQVNSILLFILIVLLAGLVGTARLSLNKYEPVDLYGGYLVGFVSQFIALRFLF